MLLKPNHQTIQLCGIVAGRLISGTVTFSPALRPGVLSELAKFEAQRLLAHLVEEDIRTGRLQ